MEGCVVGSGCNRSRSHALEECPPPLGGSGGALGGGERTWKGAWWATAATGLEATHLRSVRPPGGPEVCNDVPNQPDCRPWAELPGTAYAFVVGVGFGSGGMSPHPTAADSAHHPGGLRRSFRLKTHGSARGL